MFRDGLSSEEAGLVTGLLNVPLLACLIGGLLFLHVSEASVSSLQRRVHGVGGLAGEGVGALDEQFLHKGRVE